MLADTDWFVLLLMIVLLWLAWPRQPSVSHHANVTARVQRLLKPRTSDDCPICRQQALLSTATAAPCPLIIPWRERKSRRGRPKRINTQGFACPNRTCAYYQISDAHIHALGGDGSDGTSERIQTLRCQACNTTFSTRRDTPLYRLKTASQRVAEVLTALAEGVDIAAAARIFGHRHATITTWLTRAGQHSATLHNRVFQHLHLPHLQLDELRTRLRSHTHVLWLWVAVDPLSKIIPVLHHPEGTRGAHTRRCTPADPRPLPAAGAGMHTRVHKRRLKPLFLRADGPFWAEIRGVGRRAGQWHVAAGLLYGQIKKHYRRRRLVRVTQVLRCGTRAAFKTALQTLGLSGRLNTAFVERVNLTLRQSVAALVRRTWSTMQDAPQLFLHGDWWRAYYHFVRTHESLRVLVAQPVDRGDKRLPQRYRQRTPAMAAGLTGKRWTVQELLALPLPPAPTGAG